eukprot:Platyproteum_vivax@DN5604_c0_g1_i5.p1
MSSATYSGDDVPTDAKSNGRKFLPDAPEELLTILRQSVGPLTHQQCADILIKAAAVHKDIFLHVESVTTKLPTYRRLMVRSIAFTSTSEGLLSAFRKFGEVEEGAIVMDRVTKVSRGFGFVTFKHAEDAKKAMSANVFLDGRQLLVKLAVDLGAGSLPPLSNDLAQRKLFVRNLGDNTTSEALRQELEKHGEMEECTVIRDQDGHSKGYAFVTYLLVEGAAKALQEPQRIMNERMIFISLAAQGKARTNNPRASHTNDSEGEVGSNTSWLRAGHDRTATTGGAPFFGRRRNRQDLREAELKRCNPLSDDFVRAFDFSSPRPLIGDGCLVGYCHYSPTPSIGDGATYCPSPTTSIEYVNSGGNSPCYAKSSSPYEMDEPFRQSVDYGSRRASTSADESNEVGQLMEDACEYALRPNGWDHSAKGGPWSLGGMASMRFTHASTASAPMVPNMEKYLSTTEKYLGVETSLRTVGEGEEYYQFFPDNYLREGIRGRRSRKRTPNYLESAIFE